MYTTNSAYFPGIEFETIEEAAEALQAAGEAGTIYDADGKAVAQYGPDGFIIY